MFWFCTLHVVVYVVLLIFLSWVIKYVKVSLHIMYFCALCWAFVVSRLYLSGLLWEVNGSQLFGGVMCFEHLTILKRSVHEEYHLVLFMHVYLVSMWYASSWDIQLNIVHLLSLEYSPLVLYGVSHYGEVICYVYITNLVNVYYWGHATCICCCS